MSHGVEQCAFFTLVGFLLTSQITVGQVTSVPRPVVPSKPAVIDSTFVTKDSFDGQITVHLHEEDGELIKDLKSKGVEHSESIKYEKVNFVQVQADSLAEYALKRIVAIRDSDGKSIIIFLRTETEARDVADYVGQQAALEQIGDAWRVRKHLVCPSDNPMGCRDFKELLDHDDRDVVENFYNKSADQPTYACFNYVEREFFIFSYAHFPYFKSGSFQREVFKNGQSTDFEFGEVYWSGEDIGRIEKWSRGQKPETVGSVDASSLAYQVKFTNKLKTATEYTLNIRWSTGRYTENFSWKDGKGEPFSDDSSGICGKLN